MNLLSDLFLKESMLELANPADIFRELPFFPGQILVWLLLSVSVVSWATIVIKSLGLSRLKIADRYFLRRLKRSRSCLEIFQRGENHRPSPLYEIYRAGARTVVLEVAGDDRVDFLNAHDLFPEKVHLSASQLDLVDDHFERCKSWQVYKMMRGFSLLKGFTIWIPAFGLFGACWYVVMALNVDGAEVQVYLNYAIFLIVLSFLVVAPAGLGNIILGSQYQKRGKRICRFRNQVARAFSESMEKPPIHPDPPAPVRYGPPPPPVEEILPQEEELPIPVMEEQPVLQQVIHTNPPAPSPAPQPQAPVVMERRRRVRAKNVVAHAEPKPQAPQPPVATNLTQEFIDNVEVEGEFESPFELVSEESEPLPVEHAPTLTNKVSLHPRNNEIREAIQSRPAGSTQYKSLRRQEEQSPAVPVFEESAYYDYPSTSPQT